MDSRDREVSSCDEDALLSFTAGLAKEAAVLFQSRRFGECVDVLNQLLQKKEDDPKVLHNIAIAECFRDGCSDPKKLLEVLKKVKKRSEDLARASGDQADAGNTVGNNVISGSKGSNTSAHQFSGSNSTSVTYTDEFDTSVATLNIAIVLFHLHEYGNALSTLEPLYQNIEPIDETTALHICLLLLDVALGSRDAMRAADVIQYLEKAFGAGYMISQGDNGSTAQIPSSNLPVKTSSVPSNSTALDISNSDSALTSSENPLARTLSDEALEYETLLSRLDIGGQSLARPPGFSSSNDISRTSLDQPVPAADLKLKLHLYRVRLLLLTRNLKAAKREMKLAMNISRGRDSSTALLLKSQLEYARGNHRKAIKLLMTLNGRTESWMPIVFSNDFGCIYHHLSKHQLSALLFSKALRSSSHLRTEKPLKLSTFSQDKSLLIVYNCGLQHLMSGKPIVAAQCLQKASSVFYDRPLFWLRIAECCLLALEKGILDPTGAFKAEDVTVRVAGKGKWRQLVVEEGESRSMHLNNVELNDGLLDRDSQQKLSAPFARQCLLNALHLLNNFEMKSSRASLPCEDKEDGSSQTISNKNSNYKNISGGDAKLSNIIVLSSNGDGKDTKGLASQNTTLQNSVSMYEDICRRENRMIKQAVLADLAYIELTLENPSKALTAATSLLRLPECSRIYIFLGHIYAAEALCQLNRPKEASDHLSVYLSDGNNAEFPFSEEDRQKCGVEKLVDGEEVSGGSVAARSEPLEEIQGSLFLKPEEALGTLFVNLASISAVQGDLEQAHRFAMKGLSTIPNHPQAILAAAYVDLLLGKSQDALIKLKQCSRVRFLPNGVKMNGSS